MQSAVAISHPAWSFMVCKRQIVFARRQFRRSLAPIVARNRSKPLRLDTVELPENFKNRS
jgi:hypothetical protein